MNDHNDLQDYTLNIAQSGLSIYDTIETGDPRLWIPNLELERLLNSALANLSLRGLPLRTRSKVVKQATCQALGYPVPSSFKKTRPRFPGQDFDTYVQKSDNLQIWNDEITPTRRYVLIRLSSDDIVTSVRVVTGEVLASLDRTGTLTQKYQARLSVGLSASELVNDEDTNHIRALVTNEISLLSFEESPVGVPTLGTLLPIREVFERIRTLVGVSFKDAGFDQERNRGAELHRLVCRALGYKRYQDIGQFPDVLHQLLEVKLQTSPTIDLGLVKPDSRSPLLIPQINSVQVRHCDVRYAVFLATTDGENVKLTHVVVSTGESFFTKFTQFGGKEINRKLQVPLPRGFFL